MTIPDRTPDGALLVGQGPSGGVHHAAVGGHAACSLDVPLTAPVAIGEASARRWCQRIQCRRHLRPEIKASKAAAYEVEHICPNCYVERPTGNRSCPSCGCPYAAVPESALA